MDGSKSMEGGRPHGGFSARHWSVGCERQWPRGLETGLAARSGRAIRCLAGAREPAGRAS